MALLGLSECGGADHSSAADAGRANPAEGGSSPAEGGATQAGQVGDRAAGEGGDTGSDLGGARSTLSDAGAAGPSSGGSATSGAGGDAGSAGNSSSAGSTGSAGANSDCEVLGVPGHCLARADCDNSQSSVSDQCSASLGPVCCTPFGQALCDPAALPRPAPNAGNTAQAPGSGGCPDGMVAAGSFCIDEYEASLVRVRDGSAWIPFDNPGTTLVRAVSVANAVPQAYIDRNQAADACANAGKRLCSDSEWLRACRGPSGTTYPYGNTRQPGTCNEQRAVHPAVEYFGTTDPVIYSMLSNSCLDQLPRSVDRTGALTGCVTTEGAFDMMGNLLEWTADPSGTLRGGSYEDTVLNGMGCSYVTTAHSELYSDYSTGFRCCADSLL